MANQSASIVIGQDCPIHKIVTTLQKHDSFGLFHIKWSDFARELETPNERVIKFRKDQLVDKITLSDAVNEVIEDWVGRNGNAASLLKLISVVEGIGIQSCADCLRLEFNMPCGEALNNPLIAWADIPPTFQQKVMYNAQLLFPDIDIQDTVTKLKGTALTDLMTGKRPQLLKDTLPPLLTYYVNRTLRARDFISNKILAHDSSDILLFTGMERHELSGMVKGVTGNSRDQLRGGITAKLMILDKTRHFDQICNGTDLPVHWLHREDKSRLRWMKSKGDMTLIQKYIDQSQDHFREEGFPLNLKFNSSLPVCISDSPGMGKSVLLAQIGRRLRELYPKRIILFIVMREFIQHVKQIGADADDRIDAVEKALQNLACENELGKIILNSKVNSPNEEILTELLLDGFDEVDSADSELGHETLGTIRKSWKSTRVWVTSRPHLLHELESTLNVLGYNIQPFSEENQAVFLVSCWSQSQSKRNLDREKLKQFAIKCLDHLKLRMKSEDHDIAGIPLQCLLIGEVFEDDAVDYAEQDDGSIDKPSSVDEIGIQSITQLYQRLIRKKFQKYESLSGTDEDTLTEKDLMIAHSWMSLELLFPEQFDELEGFSKPVQLREILKVGIVEEFPGSPARFIHRTFAEYFIAWFMADRMTIQAAAEERYLLACLLRLDCLDYPQDMTFTLTTSVLKCKETYPKLYSKDDWITSYEFRHGVISYFFNSLINGRSPHSNLASSLDKLFDLNETMRKIAHACVNSDFIHIFNFLDGIDAFDKHGSFIFDSEFLLVAIQKSKFLVGAALSHFEKYHDFDLEMQANALREAVRKPDFSTVEYFLKEKNLSLIVEELKGTTFRLVHDCIQGSYDDSESDLEQKIQIMRSLVSINPVLMRIKFRGTTPLLDDMASVILLDELIRLGANVFSRSELNNDTLLHLSIEHRGHFSSEDYHALMLSIPPEKLGKLVILKGESGRTPLHSLVVRLDPTPSTLDMFAMAGADFTCPDNYGSSPLELAVMEGRKGDTMRKLIELGADMMWKGRKYEESLLHLAAQSGNVDTVEVLVQENGMDINIPDKNGLTPLDYVVRNGIEHEIFHGIGQALREAGGKVKAVNSSGESALHVAARKHDITTLKAQLYLDMVDVNGVDKEGNTPFHLAMAKKEYEWSFVPRYSEMAELLLDNNGDPNAPLNKRGETPFLVALKNVDLDMDTYLLLKSKAEWTPTIATHALNYVVTHAKKVEDDELFEALVRECIAHRGDVHSTDAHGETVMQVAVGKSDERTIQLLVKLKGIDFYYEGRQSMLHVTAKEHNIKSLRLLLQLGVLDVNGKDSAGCTPLHLAMEKLSRLEYHYADMAKLLIDNKADPQAADIYGRTPLDIALTNDQLSWEFFDLLRPKVDDEEWSPAQVILSLQFLIQKGKGLDDDEYETIGRKCTADGASSLFDEQQWIAMMNLACTNDDPRGAKLLIKIKGIVLNSKGETWLHLAAEESNVKLLKFLLQLDPPLDINQRDNQDNTPLHSAMNIFGLHRNSLHDVVQLLLDNKADPNLPNKYLDTPFAQFLRGGPPSRRAFKLLKAKIKWTPTLATLTLQFVIRNAEEFENAEFDFLLLQCSDNGAEDVSTICKGIYQQTLLHAAVKNKNEPLVQRLVQSHSGDVNAKDIFKYTPLHRAASCWRTDPSRVLKIIRCLIDNGADVLAVTELDGTFLQILTKNRIPSPSDFQPVVKCLVEVGHANLFNVRGPSRETRRTPFQLAARQIRLDKESLILLQSNGVKFDGVIYIAREYGRSEEWLGILKEYGAT